MLRHGLLAALLLLPTLALAGKPAPVCGDGKVRAPEECDGSALGGETCVSLGYAGGTLACASDCTFDESGCTTASTCGDGVTEDYEECDGADDAACPSECSDHCACPELASGGDLEIHVIDVGQGDAILVLSPDGYAMLVDAGEESEASYVDAYLTSLGLTGLDYTLVTHMHADHVGAMDVLMGSWGPVAAFDHGATYSSTEYAEYDTAADTRRTTLTAGETIDMGASVVVDVHHADAGSSNENNNSVVVSVTYGTQVFLIGGDCESSCEGAFDPGPVHVYKVHHHGSATATSEDFLALIAPDTALISVGASNAYGHPDTTTLDLLDLYGVTVYRTDLDGDLEVISDGSVTTVNGVGACTESDTRTCGTTDVGACSLGVETCTGGAWGGCTAVEPTTEDCGNGLDDDCDGDTDTDDSDCVSSTGSVVITQVSYDTVGTDSLEEFVDLYNPTTSDIGLDGWTLDDNYGSYAFAADVTIPAGAYLSVATDAAGFAALYGLDPDVDGLTLTLGNTGDYLTLYDDVGLEADYVAWEDPTGGWDITAGTGESIDRTDPDTDTDTVSDWAVVSAWPHGGTTSTSSCGDGTCDAGEDCTTCAADCDGKTGGKPSGRYCCGNGTCESVGEDASTCPIDCA